MYHYFYYEISPKLIGSYLLEKLIKNARYLIFTIFSQIPGPSLMKRSKKDKDSVSYICEDSSSSGESSNKDNISKEGINKKFYNPCTLKLAGTNNLFNINTVDPA